MQINECVKGINWGNYIIEDNTLKTSYNNKTVFKIPYNKIINSGVVNKNELVLDLQDDNVQDNEDALCEMRFYIPQQQSEMREECGNTENEDKEQNAAEILHSEIVKRAKIGQFAGETIVTIPEIPLIIPRGKYIADFYQTLIRFHGSTYDYKIEYKNIGKAFLLPKIDSVHMVIVLALIKPIRQGNTSHPYIVMQFKKDLEETIKIKLSEQQRKSQYGEVLKEEYTAPVYEIVSKMLKIIVGVNIIIPENFKSSLDQPGIRCAVKAQEGQLFPLKKSMIFITKPVIFTRLDEIALVEFHRTGTTTFSKMFDLSLKLKDKKEQITFVGIDKKEMDILANYFQSKKVQVQKVEDVGNKFDEQYEESSDEEEKVRPKMAKKDQAGMDEEDEEEDEDFNVADVKDSESGSDEEEEDNDPDQLKKEK